MGASLAKILDKAFVLGYVLPALLFATALLAEFGCPAWLGDACDATGKNPFAQLTYAVLGVYVLAVLLLALNYALYRILEGYVPPVTWFPWCQAHQERRFHRLKKEIKALGKDPRGDFLLWEFRKKYPTEISDVLPTAFGNAIRAFEVYPRDTYGADSISVWPRLLAVIPARFQALIDEAKALVDLCVNLCLLSAVILLSSIGRTAADVYRAQVSPAVLDVRLPVAAACISVLAAFTAYRFAVMLVPDWGEQVKSAFDCYLGTLAKQLGYALPPTRKERKKFWEAFSQMILYGGVFNAEFATTPSAVGASGLPAGRGNHGDDADDDAADDEEA
jgi:hypothetical protein